MREEQHSIEVFHKSRDKDGKEIYSITDILSASRYYQSDECENTVGDDNANGTLLLSITLADEEVFVCTDALGSSNLSAMLKVVVSDANAVGGTETDFYFIDCQNIGINGESKEAENPIFVHKNTSGAAEYILLYAPQIGWGAADDDNNDALHRFYAKLGGYIY